MGDEMARQINVAQIENGKVVNVVVVDPDNWPNNCAGWPEVTGGAWIGWDYDEATGQFIAPPEMIETE